jgi:hypothetical protein
METRPYTCVIKFMSLAILMFTPLLFGCASVEDLDVLNKTMSANKRTIEMRIHKLEQSGKQLEERHAALHKHVEETMRHLSDTTQRYEASLDVVESQQGAIAKLLDAQEAFHREGLRSVQGIRSNLGSGPASFGINSRTEKSPRGLPEIASDEPLRR